jgi:hypothetical protein
MKNSNKPLKASKELTELLTAIMELAPAENDRMYKLTAGKTTVEVNGECINDINITLQACAVLPDDTPEKQFVRKFKALQVSVKHRVYEYFRITKRPGSTRELQDMGKLLEAIEKNGVNEDMIKLAKQYFDIPPIEFDNFN